MKIRIITLSDRAYKGVYRDKSGPLIKKRLMDFFTNIQVPIDMEINLIPDDETMLRDIIANSVSKHTTLIFSTGGTGLSPRDIVPDVVKPMLTKEIPGIMEMIRLKYGKGNPMAVLSRGVAGLIGNTLIFTLPGSEKAVDEYLTEIFKILTHCLETIHSIDNHY